MKTSRVFTREWRWYLSKLLRYIQIPSLERSQIHRSSRVGPRSTLIDSSMARHSSCGFDCTIVNADIGAFVNIADRVSIGAPQHPTQWVSISEVFYKPGRLPGATHPIERNRQLRCTIAPDCWIGTQSVIMPGVHVGLGAVIGANAVVTRDVPPDCTVVGIPARPPVGTTCGDPFLGYGLSNTEDDPVGDQLAALRTEVAGLRARLAELERQKADSP